MAMRFIFLVLILIPGALWARLGETPEQCVQRYGIPQWVDKEKSQGSFVKDGITITAAFSAGKCVILQFQWPDDATGVDSQRSELARKSLGPSVHLISENIPGQRVWETRNRARCAIEQTRNRLLIAYQRELDGPKMDLFKDF